jgi:hypothetical protein
MKSTRADGRISTSCNFEQHKFHVRNKSKPWNVVYITTSLFTCIKKCNRIPCNRSSSKLDDPEHQARHLHQMQIERPACLKLS